MNKRIAILLCVICIIVGLGRWVTSKPTDRPTAECEKIRQDVSTALHIGEEAKEVEAYFRSRGWRSGSAPLVGLYSAEVPIAKTFLGEKHIVRILIETNDGKISAIKVEDVYRFL